MGLAAFPCKPGGVSEVVVGGGIPPSSPEPGDVQRAVSGGQSSKFGVLTDVVKTGTQHRRHKDTAAAVATELAGERRDCLRHELRREDGITGNNWDHLPLPPFKASRCLRRRRLKAASKRFSSRSLEDQSEAPGTSGADQEDEGRPPSGRREELRINLTQLWHLNATRDPRQVTR